MVSRCANFWQSVIDVCKLIIVWFVNMLQCMLSLKFLVLRIDIIVYGTGTKIIGKKSHHKWYNDQDRKSESWHF